MEHGQQADAGVHMKHSRTACRAAAWLLAALPLQPGAMETPAPDRLELSFELGSGSYATAVLRELLETSGGEGDRSEVE